MARNIRKLRRGAVLPMFGFLLPVIFILCGLAVNLAYMRLTKTEMKIATDCSSHAGGRAMSIDQTTDSAIFHAKRVALLNTVGGEPLNLADDQVTFGATTRANNGYGRYVYDEKTKSSVDSGAEKATSVRVYGSMDVPILLGAIPGVSSFELYLYSTATQVDRDIALVLDRSGSMLYYQDDSALSDALWTLYNTYESRTTPGYWRWNRRRGRWVWVEPQTEWVRKISYSEYQDATEYLYYRDYSNNVINQLADISQEMSDFAYDWQYASGAPRYSRWALLADGVDAFLDVLETTDQEERVSLVTFSSAASLDLNLQQTYDSIRNEVDAISPYGATAIGEGLETGLPPIISGNLARQFAAKTIVVLTDGIYNTGVHPDTAVSNIVGSNNVTIHTVTFTPGADQSMMQNVATAGGGKHYHADDGEGLIEIFEEIANNLPTILTE